MSSRFLDALNQKESVTPKLVRRMETILESQKEEFNTLSLEWKCGIFLPEVLSKVQFFYDSFELLSAFLNAAIDRYLTEDSKKEPNAGKNFADTISELDIPSLKHALQEAIDVLNANK